MMFDTRLSETKFVKLFNITNLKEKKHYLLTIINIIFSAKKI